MERRLPNEQYETVVRLHGNPVRVFADSAILRYIGELTGDASTRFCAMNGFAIQMVVTGSRKLASFARITGTQVNWICAPWDAETSQAPGLAALNFAREHARDFFAPRLDVPDP